MHNYEWLYYPGEIRIIFEEFDESESNIIIGSDKNDITYRNWQGFLVVNKKGDQNMVPISFKYDDIQLFPNESPKFTSDIPKNISHLFNEHNQLKIWNPSISIKQNLKQILSKL